jgi:predicted ATPase
MVGREQETRQLAKLFLQPHVRLLTIVGPPGVGKTRTSLHVAEKIAHHFEHGAVFVNLAPLTKHEMVLHALADALGLVETSTTPGSRMLETFLQDRNLLIVLDNFEQVLPAAPWLAGLLGAAPSVKMIVTSREALRVQGEHEFPLAPLPVPAENERGDISLLDGFPAVRLFVQRAAAVQPDFELTDQNASLVAEVCRRLDGLPLAIELAAARIQTLSLADMLAQFDRLFDWLTRGRRDTSDWRQTLLGAIEWSYSLLTEAERLLLARLAVFSGGWTLESAEAVCSDAHILRKKDILDLLSQLVDRSLVVMESGNGNTRYRYLDTIHHFSLSKLKESSEWGMLQIRRLEYYSEWAQAMASRLDTDPPMQLRSKMDAEGNNIRAALEFGLQNSPPPLAALGLVCAAGSLWLRHSHFKEALSWVTRYLPFSNNSAEVRSRLLFLAAALSYWRDNLVEALEYGLEGERLAKKINDASTRAALLCYLGDVYRESGELESARKVVEESALLSREARLQVRLSMALTGLGVILYQLGERETAQLHLDEAIDIALAENSMWAQSYALRIQADNLRFDGKFDEAYRAYEHALAVSSEIDDRISTGMELANLSLLANLLDDYSASAYYAGKALALFQSIGNEYQQPFPLRMLAYAYVHENDLKNARTACMASLTGNRTLGHKTGIIASLVCLAGITYAEGNRASARSLLQTLQSEIHANSISLMEPDAKALARLMLDLKVDKKSVSTNSPDLRKILDEFGMR